MTPLPASLTLANAPAALRSLRAALDANGAEPIWRIDASPVTRVDTSALAVLLECARMAAGRQRRLELVGVPSRLADLALLYGVQELIGLPATAG